MAARFRSALMDKAQEHVKETMPQGAEYPLLASTQEQCFLEKGKGSKYRTTCPLSYFDIGRDALTDGGIPEETQVTAMQELWLDKDQPSFLHTVLVEVNSKHLVWGSLHRLSDDIPIRSLCLALYKAHKDGNSVKTAELQEVANSVPIEFVSATSGVYAWMVGQERLQEKKKDAIYEQDTALAVGDGLQSLPMGHLLSALAGNPRAIHSTP